MPREASMADAKNRLSSLVNMVAHGRQRVVLTSRGHPKAALVALEDLAVLEDLSPEPGADESALAEADMLRERILSRRGKALTDSVRDLEAIRRGER